MILNRNAIIVRPLKAQSNNNLINDDTNDVMTFTGNDNANAFSSIAIGFKSPQLVHKTSQDKCPSNQIVGDSCTPKNMRNNICLPNVR